MEPSNQGSETDCLVQDALFACFLKSYRTLRGKISVPKLEKSSGAGALVDDVRGNSEMMTQLREQLPVEGFTAAPGSAELVRILNQLPAEELHQVGAEFRKCVGLSRDQLLSADRLSLNPVIAGIVLASLAQLELLLPADAIVLGPLEGTFRGQRGGISWLHNDEERTSQPYLAQVLFPLPRAELGPNVAGAHPDDMFRHYVDLKARLEGEFPELNLPDISEWDAGDGSVDTNTALSFTERVVAAIHKYHSSRTCLAEDELVLDFINVWIPKAGKQIAMLPLKYGGDVQYQRDTRPSVEEVEAAGFTNLFEAFSSRIAVMFFGRYVLHQVAEGPEIAKCSQGSMETRYLVLMPRKSAHRFSLCRPSAISLCTQEVRRPILENSDVNADGTCSLTCERAQATLAHDARTTPRGTEEASSTASGPSSLGDEPHLAWYLSLWED